MTPQEAIQEIKSKVYRNTDDCEMTISKDCYKAVLNALKKQIPKKVIPFERTAHDFETGICKHSGYICEHIKPFNKEYKYTDYKCPNCNCLVVAGTPNRCVHCGQALDWSET